MGFLKQIGIEGIIKGFVIFTLYGFVTTVYISAVHGLDADLPKDVMSTLEGPISIHTYGWLTVVGLFLLFAVTNFGMKEVDIENKRPKRVFYFAMPFCESAITLGVVIGATFLGIAIASQMLYLYDFTEVIIYNMFYSLAVFMFLVTYPVCMFVIAILDYKNEVKLYLNIATLIYISIAMSFLYYGLPIADVVEVGLYISLFMIIYMVLRWKFPKAITKTSR